MFRCMRLHRGGTHLAKLIKLSDNMESSSSYFTILCYLSCSEELEEVGTNASASVLSFNFPERSGAHRGFVVHF